MTKIITVSDHRKREQIQELFARHHIEYMLKVKDILQKNPVDAAKIGTLGMNKMKMQYSFYVDKADSAMAKELVAGIAHLP